MNNHDYHQRVMTQYTLREYTQQRQATVQATNETPTPLYQTYADEVLHYPIFTNHACHEHTAKALLGKNLSEDYCRRWLYFHTPDVAKLPHVNYAEQLFTQHTTLRQQLRAIHAPRLALFSLVFLLVIILTARGHFLTTLLPITLLTIFWQYSETAVRRKETEITVHIQHLLKLRSQYWELQDQLDYLPPVIAYPHFAKHYQQAIQNLLCQTLNSLLRPHELANINDALHKRQWRVFGLESWGLLQLPLGNTPAIQQWLLTDENRVLAALQPATQQHATLYRLTYWHLWVLTDQGILMGSAFYERVADQCLQVQQEFIPYTQIAAFEMAQALLPEVSELKTLLPEAVYQTYFQQPVPILTLQTKRGTRWQCAALPQRLACQPSGKPAKFDELARAGITTDLRELEHLLHARLYMQQAG